MSVTLRLLRNKTVNSIQAEFNTAYPFLKIDMYKPVGRGQFEGGRVKLGHSVLLESLDTLKEGEFLIFDSMTVGQLEKSFLEKFGVLVQVSRKSGSVWLETTMTDNWTLKQQNDHGRELSEPAGTSLPADDAEAQ